MKMLFPHAKRGAARRLFLSGLKEFRKGLIMSKTHKTLLITIALCCSVSVIAAQVIPVDGTAGAPLGGIGTGAVKFCSHQGTFYGALGTPCARPNFSQLPNMQFELFTNRNGTVQTSQKLSAVVTNGRADDDAIYPVQYANLGTVSGVSVSLTAFAPYDPANLPRMCYPYAFYQVMLKNTQTTSINSAIALQVQTSSTPTIVGGKGLKTAINRALYASCDKAASTISVGSDNGFFTSGICSNSISGATNRVAADITLAAGDSALVRFVFSWFDPDTARYWYYNAGANAAGFADTGLAYFDAFRSKATELVTRMRASNFPGWLVDQTLNKLCNLTNNSAFLRDGRYFHTEGEWGLNGTMDQMWHARQMNTMFAPYLAWQELHYWARTQKTNPAGQIHHDFGHLDTLTAWDDQQHADYRDIDKWVDLNCGFIVSVYEAFVATDDQTQLSWLWPYVKKAAQRILDLVALYSAPGYPYTFSGTENSYDAGGNADPFNASMSATAYKAMARLATVENEPALATQFQAAFDTVTQSFAKRYLSNNFPGGQFCESVLGGQWMGFYLKFGDYFPKQALDYGLISEDSYYRPLSRGFYSSARTYNEWGPYLVSHLGGLYLQTGNLTRWRAMQYDYAQRTFGDRNMVFNTYLDIPPVVPTPVYLATSADGYQQYMSLPVLWRNYYTLVGFQRNKHTGELWLEPRILPEMNHVMNNALIVTPEGYVTMSCTETGQKYQNRHFTVFTDQPMNVTSMYLRDDYGQNVTVSIGGTSRTVTRVGSGYSKELKIDWNGTLGTAPTIVDVSGDTTADITPAFIAYTSPYQRYEAEWYAKADTAIRTQACSDTGGGSNIAFTYNNTFLEFDSLNFSQGAVACSLRVAAATGAGGTVELRIDSVAGTLVGTATIPSTGGWQTYATVSTPASQISGVHALFIVFKTSNQFAGNLNWFRFKPATSHVVGNPFSWATTHYRNGKFLISTRAGGPFKIEILSPDGRVVRMMEGVGARAYSLDAGHLGWGVRLPEGIYLVSVCQDRIKTVTKIALWR